MKETLLNLLDRYRHLSEYAETKLGILIAFNSAIIIGLSTICKDQEKSIQYLIILITVLNISSLIFAFSGVFAKSKNNHSSSKKTVSKNYFYYKYVAQLNEYELIENIRKDYELDECNKQMENDLGNQIVVLAKNADRKFNFFIIGLNFTIASLISPLGLLIIHIYNNPN
jgi:hypothetical protein